MATTAAVLGASAPQPRDSLEGIAPAVIPSHFQSDAIGTRSEPGPAVGLFLFVHRQSLAAAALPSMHVWSPTMRFPRQSIAPFAAIALLCGPLSACASDVQQPTTLPAPSEALSPSAAVTSPSAGPDTEAATAPVLPAEAREQTAAGAIAFVRHYFAVLDYAYATGDTAPLANISDPECQACTGVSKMINQTMANDESYEVTTTQLSGLRVSEAQLVDALEVLVKYSTTGTRTLDRTGKFTVVFPPSASETASFIVFRSITGWSIGEVGEGV